MTFLMLPQWKVVLNYRFPKTLPKYNPKDKNVIITWDILMQDFRVIPCDSVEVVQVYKATEEAFGPVFNKLFYPMTPQQKMKWMDA